MQDKYTVTGPILAHVIGPHSLNNSLLKTVNITTLKLMSRTLQCSVLMFLYVTYYTWAYFYYICQQQNFTWGGGGGMAQSASPLATGWKVWGSSPGGGNIFSPHSSRSALGSTQFPIQWVSGPILGVEWPEGGVGHPPTSGCEVNESAISATPPWCMGIRTLQVTVLIDDVVTLRKNMDRSFHGSYSCINRLQHLNIITEFNLLMLIPTDPIAARYFYVSEDISELKNDLKRNQFDSFHFHERREQNKCLFLTVCTNQNECDNHRRDADASLPKREYENAFSYFVVRITKPNSFNWPLVLNLNIVMGKIASFSAPTLRLEVILLSER